MSPQRTFATIATNSTYGRAGDGVLVGRMIANTAFIEALGKYSKFDRFRFYIGEHADEATIQKLFGNSLADRIEIRNLLHLEQDFSAADFTAMHYGAHLDRFGDLTWLRDRYATKNIPITGQIHSLSYPRSLNDYMRFYLLPPRETDAILCSTESGKRVVENSLNELRESLRAKGTEMSALQCEMPVIPLGIDAKTLQGGDGAKLRSELDIPSQAFCALALARFSEFDKMDLFPLLLAFRGVVERMDRPAILLLAGARQGTKTPEMIQLWARALGIESNLRFMTDFPEVRKPDVLAAADVFVSPTDNVQETFGITVIEAMAAGLPPIVADFDGYRESVTEDVGIRIPTHWSPPSSELCNLGPLLNERPLHLFLGQGVTVDGEAMEQALFSLGADAELRAKFSSAARERAEQRYDWSQVIPQYEALVDRLASKSFTPGEHVGPDSSHPLAYRFEEIFAHYPTTMQAPDRTLVTSAHGRKLSEARATPPIYPELTNLFDEVMVSAALLGAGAPIPANVLAAAVTENFPNHPLWQSEFLLAWMQKQGLLDQVS
ncbi:MAG: D-inositol-3-phosphate glycosyltransferase [Planctomycetota bacterium]|jgi:D-inositol-3-phosphate glycosyltransferase